MSTSEKQTVLITGASGFIATHVVEAFLNAGFKVRGTVRTESTAKKARATHNSHPAEQLEFVIVPDIAAPGAFDEAVKGVDGVIHTASPFTFDVTDFDKELFEPAVHGTVSVLEAVKKNNPAVKRVVITSSFASNLDPTKGLRPGYTYTEKDWDPITPEQAKEMNSSVVAYLVSKTIAEQAAWDFVEKEKPNFSITTLCPPMVYGPIASDFDSMAKLNTSSLDIYRLFNGTEKDVPEDSFPAEVDVRDLAKAHVLAYTTEAAANQRYIIAGSKFVYQGVVNFIHKKFPDLRATTPVGHPDAIPEVMTLDTSKARKELGIEFRSFEETMEDTINALRALEKKLAA